MSSSLLSRVISYLDVDHEVKLVISTYCK